MNHKITQAEINAFIASTVQHKMRCGATDDAVVVITQYSARKFHLGFHFENGCKVGEIRNHADGSKYLVVGVV